MKKISLALPARRIMVSFFLLLLSLILLSAASFTDNPNKDKTAKETAPKIIAAFTGQLPPLEYFDYHDSLKGLGVDILNYIARSNSYKLEYCKFNTYSAALEAVKSGKADLIISPETLAGRSQDIKFTRSFLHSPALIIMKKAPESEIGLLQLYNLNVGVIKDYPTAYFLQAHFPAVNTVLFDEPLSAFKALFKGSLDALVVVEIEYQYFLTFKEYELLQIAGKAGFDLEYTFAVNSANEDLWWNLDNALETIPRKDKENIIRRYIPDYGKVKIDPKIVLIVIIIIFALTSVIFAAILIWNFTLKRQVNKKTLEINNELAERKLAEERLRQSDEKNTAIIQALPDLMFHLDRNGVFIGCSGNQDLMLEKPDVFLGKCYKDLLPQDIVNKTQEGLDHVFSKGTIFIYEYSLNIKGKDYEFEARMVPCGEDSVLVLVRDVTELRLSQRARQESEKLYYIVTSTLQEGLGIVDAEENVIFANTAYGEVFGYPAEELVGKNLRDFVSPEEFKKIIQGTIDRKKGLSSRYNIKIINRYGESRDVAVSASPWRDEKGNYLGSIGLMLDITEQKETLAALRSSEERYQRMADNIQDGITIIEKGKVVYLNDRACQIFGYPKDELIKMTYIELAAPEEKERLKTLFAQAKESHTQIEQLEFWIIRKDGKRRYIQNRYSFKSRQDSPHDRYVITTDLTESKLAEEALIKSEEKYRQLVEQLNELVFTVDKEGKILYVSAYIEKMTGYRLEEVAGKQFSCFIHPEDLPMLMESFSRSLKGELHPIEYRIVRKDHQIIYARSISHAIYENNVLVGLSGVVSDITSMKRYEESLVLNESRLEALYSLLQMEQASVQDIAEYSLRQAIRLSGSANGFFGLINDDESILTLLSLSQKTMEDCCILDKPSDFYIKEGGLWTQAVIQRKTVIINNYHPKLSGAKGLPEGHIALNNLTLVPIFSGTKIVALIAVANKEEDYDETDARQLTLLGDGAWRFMQKRKAEEALKQSELKYRALFESSVDAVYISSEEGYFIDINQAAEEMFGYTREEMLGMEVKKIYKDPADRLTFSHTIKRKGFIKNQELTLKRKDGQIINCLVTATVRKTKDNKYYYQGIIRDISELKKLEGQLLQAQKMESIGRLTGGIAHDFNNLLTVISGNTEMMLMTVKGYDPMHEHLLEIQNAADRATALTRQLLAFGRKQILQPRVINLNQNIANMDRMLRRIIGEDISLLTIPQPDLWNVKVDPHQIEQVIVNLAVNARDAMPQGGKLTIETSNIMLDQDYCIKHHGAKPGNYVMLAISDTGCGMPQEILPHIFDPFFTTKEAGKGTGLGLSTVYGIIKQSEGNIYVYSEVGRGTSFKIYLPMALEKEVEEVKIGYDPDSLPRGDETVLIAEDDTAVRTMAARVLRLQGYKVIEAQSGGDAWLLSERHQGEIHLLLSDVIMPNMNGPELAKLLIQKRPNLKILYMSGYTPNAIVHDGILETGIPYLQKPFHPKTLAQKVREVLEEKA